MYQTADFNTCPIAFLGMGLMGSRMAKRLLQAHYPTAIWNRHIQACDALIPHGATLLTIEKIAQYPVILLCLADDDAVQSVIDKIYPYIQSGQIIIDFSSLSVEKTHQLASQVAKKQCLWIDSPVSGGVMGAETGSLVIFAGGDAHTIQQLSPIYQAISQRVTHMGEVGTGQATKLCNQLIVASASTIIAEAVSLAQQSGVNTQLLTTALTGGFADSKPFQILAPRMATHQFIPVQWKVQTLSKDLKNALHLAQKNHLQLPVAEQAFQQLLKHQQQGFAEHDLATIIHAIKKIDS